MSTCAESTRMSATDELRRLLDERGVEYLKDDGESIRATKWKARKQGAFLEHAMFVEYANGETDFTFPSSAVTPEQAIAATLGVVDKGEPQGADGNLDRSQIDWLRFMPDGWDGTPPTLGCGKLTAEQVRDLIKRHSMAVDYVGNVRRLDNNVFEEIADELNAALGSGECEMETDWDYLHGGITDAPEDTWAYMCSACGWSFRYDIGIKPKHCPNCGRKVKR